jgi:UDP-glucuronate 4-epimerase
MYGEGTSRRDYTYISDIVDGVEKSIDTCSSYHIYNLGESRTIALRALINVIEEHLGKKAIIEQLPVQPGDVPITYADISKARREIGYDPQVDVMEGVRRFVEWYQERRSEKR